MGNYRIYTRAGVYVFQPAMRFVNNTRLDLYKIAHKILFLYVLYYFIPPNNGNENNN